MADAFSIKFDDEALFKGLDGITAGANQETRPAAQAGAQVFYDEVLLRVPVNTKTIKKKSGKEILPGALKRAIYQAFSQDNSSEERATYHISWNAKKAPHGHLIENGTSRAPAYPFIRPSYDAKASAALQASKDRFLTGMQAQLQKVSK